MKERQSPENTNHGSSRSRKPVILIIAEGKNVTERNYFGSFRKQHAGYVLKCPDIGHVTDPANMMKAANDYWIKNKMSKSKGDAAFVVLDLDCSEQKAATINKLTSKRNHASFIVSNPCFEAWFLTHFLYPVGSFTSSSVITALSRYIPKYRKNSDVSRYINGSNLNQALQNADNLALRCIASGLSWPSPECNPRTDVPDVIREIQKHP